MKARLTLGISILALLICSGCQSRQGTRMTLNPFRNSLATTSKQCIPPPPTGSIGRNGYYQQQPMTARAQSPASLQPVPQLGSQPQSNPAEPRSAALPSDGDWESGRQPGLDFGAGIRPATLSNERTEVVQASLNRDVPRKRPATTKRSSNLAWIPPFAKGILPGSKLLGTQTSQDIGLVGANAEIDPSRFSNQVAAIPRTVAPPALLSRRSVASGYTPPRTALPPRFRVPSYVSQADINRAPLQNVAASSSHQHDGATCNCNQPPPVVDLVPSPDPAYNGSQFANVDSTAWR
jgi:hypothetical protein